MSDAFFNISKNKNSPHHLLAPDTTPPSQSFDLLVADQTLGGVTISSDPVMSCDLSHRSRKTEVYFTTVNVL